MRLRFSTKRDALDVLIQLRDYIERYGSVQLSELNHYLGRNNTMYDDTRLGWINLKDAYVTIVGVDSSYVLILPTPIRIDNLEPFKSEEIIKLCPYGDFRPCVKEDCMVYEDGKCRRSY